VTDERLPAPIEAIVRALSRDDEEADRRISAFARGVALGALVGAAIAGSTIWSRRKAIARAESDETGAGSLEPPAAE
jgi:hypothetical protein